MSLPNFIFLSMHCKGCAHMTTEWQELLGWLAGPRWNTPNVLSTDSLLSQLDAETRIQCTLPRCRRIFLPWQNCQRRSCAEPPPLLLLA